MSCSKTSYSTESVAKRGAAIVANLNGHEMRYYRCDKCPAWHLTSDGRKAGPFPDLGPARQWVDALTFLPEAKWAAEIKRVST